jgi:hypothetical protein
MSKQITVGTSMLRVPTSVLFPNEPALIIDQFVLMTTIGFAPPHSMQTKKANECIRSSSAGPSSEPIASLFPSLVQCLRTLSRFPIGSIH